DIAALCARKNVYFLDSPVSGGVAGAASGNLVLMIGGSEEVIERVRPVLDVLSSRIVHCGDTGAGQLTKLSHNLLTAINT
ncbi:NAD(P)-binding domain-containing protein, partial [Klebsiella pneumoniae]|uniref:NAD(P)-binding domain-containing protein n=3 Tax=Enterobacterales TaxID=91347 RepID=UPI00301B5855